MKKLLTLFSAALISGLLYAEKVEFSLRNPHPYSIDAVVVYKKDGNTVYQNVNALGQTQTRIVTEAERDFIYVYGDVNPGKGEYYGSGDRWFRVNGEEFLTPFTKIDIGEGLSHVTYSFPESHKEGYNTGRFNNYFWNSSLENAREFEAAQGDVTIVTRQNDLEVSYNKAFGTGFYSGVYNYYFVADELKAVKYNFAFTDLYDVNRFAEQFITNFDSSANGWTMWEGQDKMSLIYAYEEETSVHFFVSFVHRYITAVFKHPQITEEEVELINNYEQPDYEHYYNGMLEEIESGELVGDW